MLEVLSSLLHCSTGGVETWIGWNPIPAFFSYPRSNIVGEAQSAQCY